MGNTILMVTPLYAALLTLWYVVLSVRVIRMRTRTRTSLGDGGNRDMQGAIRGHGNFAEYVPLALVLMLMLELGHMSIYVLHALGVTLLIARLIHGYTLSYSYSLQRRVAGMALTFVVLGVEIVLCLYLALKGHQAWFAV